MAQPTIFPPPIAALSPRSSRLVTPLWWIMLLLSLAIVAYAAHYFVGRPDDEHFDRYLVPLRLHIAGGMGALLAGPWQFSRRLRARALGLHRWLGRFYLLEVMLGSIAGLFMSVVSRGGMATHLGFGALAVLWFFTGLQAYRKIRRGEIEAHRQWMIRNFALTLAAVALRVQMPIMIGILHWPIAPSFVAVSWLCWVPNVFVAEWMVRRRGSVLQLTA
jgi:uncharacterized membrane protein